VPNIILYEIEELSQREIVKLLNVKATRVGNYIRRAKQEWLLLKSKSRSERKSDCSAPMIIPMITPLIIPITTP
jgi:transposase